MKGKKIMKSLFEELANIEHIRWSAWQKYMHSRCIKDVDTGELIIPEWAVKQWERQIETDYKDLSEEEKNSDREQVDRYVPLIIERIKEIQASDDNGILGFLKEQIIKMFKRK